MLLCHFAASEIFRLFYLPNIKFSTVGDLCHFADESKKSKAIPVTGSEGP
jgi:hypothetical protein